MRNERLRPGDLIFKLQEVVMTVRRVRIIKRPFELWTIITQDGVLCNIPLEPGDVLSNRKSK